MTDLNTLLNENPAPHVRSRLAAQILTAADTNQAANDTAAKRPWWSVAGVAAMAVMAAFFILQPTTDTAHEWEQLADGSGFSELYAWVEGEDS